MRFATLATLAVSATAVSAQAGLNGTYIAGVLAALTSANLTSLAGIAQQLANTTEGVAFLSALPNGNKTILAPNNDAFSAVSSDVASNTTALLEILSYHVLNTSVSTVPASPAHGVYRSFYQSNGLPNNRTSPVVLTHSNSTGTNVVSVLQADSNATVLAGPVAAANLLVYVIDTVLTVPPTLTEVASTLLPSLTGVLQQVNLVDALEATKGLTVFAPVDSAIAGVASALGSLNATQISTILGNHVINGTAVYSTLLTSANYTSASGSPFSFVSNSTGVFVTSGTATARVVQSDIITANGVVHLIDQVLVNTNSNPGAAASAAASYSQAATATTGNAGGAVGSATTTPGASSSSTSRAAGFLKAQVPVGAIAGVMASTVIGVVAGSLLL